MIRQWKLKVGSCLNDATPQISVLSAQCTSSFIYLFMPTTATDCLAHHDKQDTEEETVVGFSAAAHADLTKTNWSKTLQQVNGRWSGIIIV